MNPDYDAQLEAEIGRELQGLPELPAPATLVPCVMAAIEKPLALPWYRQPWPAWPKVPRTLSLGVLAVLFGGVCVAGWKLWQAGNPSAALRGISELFSGLGAIWSTLTALLAAAVLIVKQLGPGFIAACVFVATCAYASCVGLGTLFVRYAFARR
jgi:hypothetical protein